MAERIGRAKWDVEALKVEIRRWLSDKEVCQPDSDGSVGFSVSTLSSGCNGTHQPSEIFAAFNMKAPDGGDPETYLPDEDEFVWGDIERVAEEEESLLTDALFEDKGFVDEMAEIAPNGWGVRFGHRDTDGDYCLFFWYTTVPFEGDEE